MERVDESPPQVVVGAVLQALDDGEGVLVTQPQVTVMGLIEGPEAGEILIEVGFAVRKAVEELPLPSRQDDEAVRQAARIAVRRSFNASQGKKPLTEVHLVRL